MRRLVEAEVASVINWSKAFVGVLGIMDTVIAMPAGHQRRDHHFRSDAQRLAHEILRKVFSRFDDDASELMAKGEGPRQRLRPMTFKNMEIGTAYPAGANLNERGLFGNLRPCHRTDLRLRAGTGEGGDADCAVAHGRFIQCHSGSRPKRSEGREAGILNPGL